MIPVNQPYLGCEEQENLMVCIRDGWISSEGPFIQQFEGQISEYCLRAHGIAVANGSAALDIAVAALGLEPGDEVILPTFTIISCAAAVVRAGAVPVLVDVDPVTWNMQPETIERRITSRTKAIMAVHIYGLPVDMDAVLKIAEKYGLYVIEDAAEELGQSCRGRRVGGFGTVSTLSFYPNKHVTTGEGGMILTDDAKMAARCRDLRNLCFGKQKRFVHEELGWNYRMSNLQAAVGVAQAGRLEQTVARKREIGSLYNKLLEGTSGIQIPLNANELAQNIYWIYGVVLDDSVSFDAEEAMKRLAVLGIGTRPFFYPMHLQPVFLKMGLFKGEKYPVAERLAARGFYLPSGLTLTADEIRECASKLREILR